MSRDQVAGPTSAGDELTFLFTDIEGSTRTWLDDPDVMNAALAMHDEVLRAVFAEHAGHVFSTGGDGLYVAFDQAASAVAAAVEVQRRLHTMAWPGDLRLPVRIGVHTGSVFRRDDDYFGPTLNKTARLMAAGHGHQTLLSADTIAALSEVPDGAEIRSLGRHQLRDIVEPAEIHEVVIAGLDAVSRPLRTHRPVADLPPRRAALIGREDLVADIENLLGGNRVVTLVGPGGAGKSSLGLHLAHRQKERADREVLHVSLGAVKSPGRVADAIATQIGLRVGHGGSLSTVVQALAGGESLVVLDDVEHLVETVAEAIDPLLEVDGPRFLITSRRRLGLPSERVVAVGGLAEPDDDGWTGAARLFVERADAAGHRPDDDDDTRTDIERLCARLDHLPLGIELAAGAGAHLTPGQLDAELAHGLRLEATGRDGRRWSTLDAMVAWSYELLAEPERRLLRGMAVAHSALSTEGVRAICAPDAERAEVAAGLAQVAAASLLVADTGDDREATFRLLETVRTFAEHEARNRGEWATLERRHRDWFLGWVENATPRQRHLSGLWALDIEQHFGDLQAAMGLSADQGELHAVSRQARAMSCAWLVLARGEEGLRWLGVSRRHAGTTAEAIDHCIAEAAAAMACQRFDVFAEALGRGEELTAQLPDHELVPLLEGLRGLSRIGAPDEGVDIIDAALELDRRLGTEWAGILHQLAGDLLFFSARPPAECIGHYQLALRHYRFDTDPWWTSAALANIAAARIGEGEHDAARTDAQLAVDVAGTMPPQLGAHTRSVTVLAAAMTACGETAEAAALLLDECHRVRSTPLQPDHRAEPLVAVAHLAAVTGRVDTATDLLDLLARLHFHIRTPWQRLLWKVASAAVAPSARSTNPLVTAPRTSDEGVALAIDVLHDITAKGST